MLTWSPRKFSLEPKINNITICTPFTVATLPPRLHSDLQLKLLHYVEDHFNTHNNFTTSNFSKHYKLALGQLCQLRVVLPVFDFSNKQQGSYYSQPKILVIFLYYNRCIIVKWPPTKYDVIMRMTTYVHNKIALNHWTT